MWPARPCSSASDRNASLVSGSRLERESVRDAKYCSGVRLAYARSAALAADEAFVGEGPEREPDGAAADVVALHELLLGR